MQDDKRPSLLIVDDNEKNLHATKRMLEDLNIAIDTEQSGEAALKAILNRPYFLILMDVQMPGMDGLETVSLIRGNENYKHIPIIFLTAISKEEKYLIAGYSEGAVDYLFKPIEPIFLQSKVKVFLDLKLATRQLEKLATSDVLTGLANRYLYQSYLTKVLSLAQRHNTLFAVLILDLDHFKEVNDALGHDAGDYLLKSVVSYIKNCLRSSDLVARMGGDEFAIILTEITHPEDAGIVASSILAKLKQPHLIDGKEIFCGASIGIACYPSCGQTCEELNKAADTAMYHAKEQRNSYQFFANEMQEIMLERISLIQGLRSAIDHEEFQIFYQTKVNAITKETMGLEALLRWRHPDRGLISPDCFIPLVEQSGQIICLGAWVLQTAAAQCAKWHTNNSNLTLTIAINVSVLQLKNVGFVETIEKVLQQTALPPELLELELTESSVMQDPEMSIKILSSIRELGVKIAIDDFGTGYSSLSYLQKLPIDTIKIDLSFVQAIGDAVESNAIVKAIINLAHTLGMEVVAEGVETEEQIEFLTQEGCDYLQGFYFSKPVPADELGF